MGYVYVYLYLLLTRKGLLLEILGAQSATSEWWSPAESAID